MVFDGEALTAEQLPQRLEDLSKPVWKGRGGWARKRQRPCPHQQRTSGTSGERRRRASGSQR